MKNKQDWGDLLDYITKNFRLQSKDGKYYESDLLIELGTIFKKQITKAREEAYNEGRGEGVGRRLRDVERRQEELEERIDHLSAMLNI